MNELSELLRDYAKRAERKPDAYDLIHHAWMQGAYAGEFETTDESMCGYGQRQYRMAWRAGFDISRRIEMLRKRIKHLEKPHELLIT